MMSAWWDRRSLMWSPADAPVLTIGLASISVICAVLAWLLSYAALDVWSGLITAMVSALVLVPVLRGIGRRSGDPVVGQVLIAGFVLKMFGSMVRYMVNVVVYGGSADAGRYHEAGATFAERFRAGLPIHPIESIAGYPLETRRIGDLTGVMYLVTGTSPYAGFILFSVLCFLGQLLILRGLAHAVPSSNQRRAAVLVVLLPSLLFWPSSIGKEALMIFCLGITIYGGALLLGPKPRPIGILVFGLGVALTGMIRSHIALMSVGALAVAAAVSVLGGPLLERKASGRGLIIRVAGLVVLLALGAGVASQVGEDFGSDEASASTTEVLADTSSRTARGGSEFVPVAVRLPHQIPAAIVSVSLRPFPWEASNFTSLIGAAEGILLVALLAVSWRRLLALPAAMVRNPFLAYALAYVVTFAIGFSYLANFGILVRQRTQLLPMLLVLLTLPPVTDIRARLMHGSRVSRHQGEGSSHQALSPSPPSKVPVAR